MYLKYKVVVIYTTAGNHQIQNDYSHGSRFPCLKVYIHDCRASSTKVLYTRQPFLIPKSLYTRLPCIKYKKRYLHGSRFSCQMVFIHGGRSSSIKALFTRPPFSIKTYYLHCCHASFMKWIHVFTRQSFLKQKKTTQNNNIKKNKKKLA